MHPFIRRGITTLALVALGGSVKASEANTTVSPAPYTEARASLNWNKPDWLSDLSVGYKVSYDDNVLRVSGNGLAPKASWVDTVSFKFGINLLPFLSPSASVLKSFAVVYQPERDIYTNASAESFTAHRLALKLAGRSGNLSFNLENAFLFNDGNRLAALYSLNQSAGATGNQNDKYRNSLAHAPERERRNQDQDRYTATIQYDLGPVFVRPVSSLTFLHMNTASFNTSLAPYKGYQDYVNRYDINLGADVGIAIAQNWYLTAGYRQGFQYQAQFPTSINPDQHFSSNHYQRALLGFEGHLSWLTLKIAAGPDFRDFNDHTPISETKTTRFYGEGTASVSLSQNQSVTLGYKDYVFVSSTGLVPYEDYSYSLIYHWNATNRLGFDLGVKFLEHNYTIGNDSTGSAPSLRDDYDFGGMAGVTFTITKHLRGNANYYYDDGQNGLGSLPTKFAPGYRFFREAIVALGLQYSF